MVLSFQLPVLKNNLNSFLLIKTVDFLISYSISVFKIKKKIKKNIC